jgi:hypothetical protein
VPSSVSRKPASSWPRYGRAKRHSRNSVQVDGGVWMTLQARLELIDHPHCQKIHAQREMPGRQALFRHHQFEVADAGMVVMLQRHARLERPVAPVVFTGRPGQDAALGQYHDSV